MHPGKPKCETCRFWSADYPGSPAGCCGIQLPPMVKVLNDDVGDNRVRATDGCDLHRPTQEA